MATRSTISVLSSDRTFMQTIYCHWDGYPQHNGKILLQHYDTLEKVEQLISLGAISSLAEKVETDQPHTFAVPCDGVTVYYHRDRGDKLSIDRVYYYDGFSVKDFIRACRKNIAQQFNYVFVDGEWLVESEGRAQFLTADVVNQPFC